MELMDTSLDKFYKFIYEHGHSRIPESILGKITVAVRLRSGWTDSCHSDRPSFGEMRVRDACDWEHLAGMTAVVT